MRRVNVLTLAVFAVAVLFGSSAPAWAESTTGTLFYTTFNGGVNVHKVAFNYDGVSFNLSSSINVASTSGADGLLFAPNGNLLIAGQGNNLTEITTAGTFVTNKAPGGGSFHLALNSNSPTALVYNMNNGGCGANCISAVTLSGGGLSTNGSLYTVSGGTSQDVRGVIYDPNNSTWYYGTAPDGGSGTFGTVVFDDVLHTATLTQLTSGVYAHGLTFDPFTGDILISSANVVQQYRPGTGIVSTYTAAAGNQFDQSSADGHGHLFLASNDGNLVFLDYGSTGLIGTNSFASTQFLASFLDDIAPLSAFGSSDGGGSVPEPSSLLLLLTGTAGLVKARWRRS